MIGWRSKPSTTEEDKPKGFDDFELRLGDLMRGERATLGKSLLDVQRELKIKATHIAAIENADIAAFEAQGFIAQLRDAKGRRAGLVAPCAPSVSWCPALTGDGVGMESAPAHRGMGPPAAGRSRPRQ